MLMLRRALASLHCALLLAHLAAAARVTGDAEVVSGEGDSDQLNVAMNDTGRAAGGLEQLRDEGKALELPEWRRLELAKREEYLRRESHKVANTQDCRVKDTWAAVPNTCTAKCSGGVMTAVLQSRKVEIPQDKFGYGNECPPLCTESDKSGCGEQTFTHCALDFCLSDCSTIDIGNRVVGLGVPAAWNFALTRETEQCVFQFWKILSKSPNFRAQLVAETNPMSKRDPNVYNIRSLLEGLPGRMVLNSANEEELVLGYRGCTLQAGTDGMDNANDVNLPVGAARVCLPAEESFRASMQQRRGNKREMKFLARLQRASRKDSYELWEKASAQGGVQMEANLPGSGPNGASARAFPFTVTMAPVPPPRKPLEFKSKGGEMVAYMDDMDMNNGAAVESAVIELRPLFLGDKSDCGWTSLDSCRRVEAGTPCVNLGFNRDGKRAHVTLKNLPPYRKYEASVQIENAAGFSEPWVTKFSTPGVARGRSTAPCDIFRHWSCSGEDVVNFLPAASEEGCSLTGSNLPMCEVKNKFEVASKKPQCFGKRYWQECHPSPDWCVGNITAALGRPSAMQVCTHENKENEEKCERPGCGKSFFPWNTKTCCCNPTGGADEEEDSPGCACVTVDKCQSLGLVAAKDPKKSCRH